MIYAHQLTAVFVLDVEVHFIIDFNPCIEMQDKCLCLQYPQVYELLLGLFGAFRYNSSAAL